MATKSQVSIHQSFIEKHVINLVSEKDWSKRTKEKEKLYSSYWEKAVCGSLALMELNKECLNELNLYKILDIKNVKYILENNKLYMDKVCSWEDPYENFLCKTNHYKGALLFSADTFIPYIFGQSWSIKPESDAMWRIYSQRGQNNDLVKNKEGWDDRMSCYTGIKLKVNARKLLEVCYIDDSSMAFLWMGRVLYGAIGDIQKELQALINSNDKVDQVFGASYFYKRTEFAHEDEFRVIYNFATENRFDAQRNAKRISFPINPSELIEEFVLDPRLDGKSEQFLKAILIRMGAEESKIRKSDLYSFKSFSLQWQ